MWVRNLAPVTAEMYGAGRMIIIYTISSITGFFLSSFVDVCCNQSHRDIVKPIINTLNAMNVPSHPPREEVKKTRIKASNSQKSKLILVNLFLATTMFARAIGINKFR